jgi:hypothetical protein
MLFMLGGMAHSASRRLAPEPPWSRSPGHEPRPVRVSLAGVIRPCRDRSRKPRRACGASPLATLRCGRRTSCSVFNCARFPLDDGRVVCVWGDRSPQRRAGPSAPASSLLTGIGVLMLFGCLPAARRGAPAAGRCLAGFFNNAALVSCMLVEADRGSARRPITQTRLTAGPELSVARLVERIRGERPARAAGERAKFLGPVAHRPAVRAARVDRRRRPTS